MPSDTIEIYTGGAADAREKNKPPPPAGYGYAAYEHGIYWQLRFEGAGQIVAMQTANVKTTTENLAELVGRVLLVRCGGGDVFAVDGQRRRGRACGFRVGEAGIVLYVTRATLYATLRCHRSSASPVA